MNVSGSSLAVLDPLLALALPAVPTAVGGGDTPGFAPVMAELLGSVATLASPAEGPAPAPLARQPLAGDGKGVPVPLAAGAAPAESAPPRIAGDGVSASALSLVAAPSLPVPDPAAGSPSAVPDAVAIGDSEPPENTDDGGDTDRTPDETDPRQDPALAWLLQPPPTAAPHLRVAVHPPRADAAAALLPIKTRLIAVGPTFGASRVVAQDAPQPAVPANLPLPQVVPAGVVVATRSVAALRPQLNGPDPQPRVELANQRTASTSIPTGEDPVGARIAPPETELLPSAAPAGVLAARAVYAPLQPGPARDRGDPLPVVAPAPEPKRPVPAANAIDPLPAAAPSLAAAVVPPVTSALAVPSADRASVATPLPTADRPLQPTAAGRADQALPVRDATPPSPVASTRLPDVNDRAASVFAGIARAMTGEQPERPQQRRPAPIEAALQIAADHIPVTPLRTIERVDQPVQTGIDLARDHGVHRMIDRIETLREAADVRDTRIRLVPDSLGPVSISVRQDGDAVRVHFTASEPGTRQLIADAQPRLTELAEARGVRIERTTVDGGTVTAGFQSPAHGQPQGNGPQQHERRTPGARAQSRACGRGTCARPR